MFKELSTSIKANLYERISSPLIGSIAISWFYFNWQSILYMVLSDGKIETKLQVFTEQYSNLNTNIIYPVIAGSLIALLYPLVAYIPFWVWEKVQHAQRALKQSLSMKQQLSVEQSLLLRQEILDKDKQIRKIVSENQDATNQLKDIITTLTEENAELYHKLSELTPPDPKADPSKIQLTDTEYQILNAHTGLKDGHVQIAADIASTLNLDLDKVSIALKQLESQNFIKYNAMVEDDDGKDVPGYILDELGRKYLGYKKGQLANK
ncbi:hypothetical protein [Marinobacterium marinum]|uniref:Uncharacterized protein n=1 Tax=Marinobacterium marinum TaxID=2756129 RepID=A0A7W1WVU3_9GAMM|nr:hypothetical protein [Marinobacterium marinum]MBA4501107.1 hypothetical protein [Marinobacterium marinum]